MIDDQTSKKTTETVGDRMQSAGAGRLSGDADPERPDDEDVNLPGELLEASPLRLSNTPDQIPKLIAELRKFRGMTQAQLGEAIGYPAPVIGNIEQGSRKLGLKTLGDLFNALGGELHIEFRAKK